MKNEFDNNLTGKGWQSMRRLLDREMPEQRRRRFAWWPLALLLLPLAGAGRWWLSHQAEPAKAAPRPTEQPKISQPVAAIENADAVPAASAAEPIPPRSVFSPSESNTGTNGLLSRKGMHSSDDSKSSYEFPPHLVRTPGGSSVRGNDLLSDEGTLGENTKRSGAFEKLETLPVVPQLIENEVKSTPLLSTVTPFVTTITKKYPEPKRWSFGLAAGLASEDFSALDGFSAGVAVDWQFARKWGLRSGLQYAQYNLSEEERPVVSLDALEYADATGNAVNLGTGSPSADPLETQVLVPVERLQQLEMPLLAYWQPLRPLRIFGGISTAYTLSAQASNQSYANNQSYNTTDQSAQKNLNELTSQSLSRWQMSWQAGVGIRLGRHFELDALYRNNFSQTTADQSAFDSGGQFNPTTLTLDNSTGTPHYFLLNGIWFF